MRVRNSCLERLPYTRENGFEMASRQDLYDEVVRTFGPALERLARAYEADPDTRRDLLQDIHLALWRSFETFDARCALRTWIYRVAHNVATSHVIRAHRLKSRQPLSLDSLDTIADSSDAESDANRRLVLERLMSLIQRLSPLDRQVILLFLEGVDASSIGEITGISSGNVATKIHRIKNILVHQFHLGGTS